MSKSNKEYVEKQIKIANSASSDAVKNDALYRAGTAMEVIPCTGDSNLLTEAQQLILDASANIDEALEDLYD